MATTNLNADAYHLTRDTAESSRLEAQHEVWKTNVGYLIHPRIAETLPQRDVLVGDVGTGTGAWLLDVARQPNAQNWNFHGLDLSAAQFPPIPSSNIRFSTLNILDPVPADLEGKFDVLHLRILVMGLPTGTWVTAATNLRKLLKPGGWLQWEEARFGDLVTLQTDLSHSALRTSSEALYHSIRAAVVSRGVALDEIASLEGFVGSGGFEDVRLDLLGSDRVLETRKGFSLAVAGAFRGMIKMLASADPEASTWREGGAAWQQLDSIENAMRREELYYSADIMVVTGRRVS
ncbi:hypothetical protein LTR95_000433 [Oleoguttula sp. CCFEE 5521]